jgi:heterogeneous nuclear ribonucleoprotein U-like protein 1
MEADSVGDLEGVTIDTNNSDLNLIVDKDCLLAYPMEDEGFCYMWAGCKANFGVKSGRVVFEVHLEDQCECVEMAKDEPESYAFRVGWSLWSSSLQLGKCFKNLIIHCDN